VKLSEEDKDGDFDDVRHKNKSQHRSHTCTVETVTHWLLSRWRSGQSHLHFLSLFTDFSL